MTRWVAKSCAILAIVDERRNDGRRERATRLVDLLRAADESDPISHTTTFVFTTDAQHG